MKHLYYNNIGLHEKVNNKIIQVCTPAKIFPYSSTMLLGVAKTVLRVCTKLMA